VVSQLGASSAGQDAEYDAKERRIVWKIKKFPGGSEQTLRSKASEASIWPLTHPVLVLSALSDSCLYQTYREETNSTTNRSSARMLRWPARIVLAAASSLLDIGLGVSPCSRRSR